jgi:hypothetical protein
MEVTDIFIQPEETLKADYRILRKEIIHKQTGERYIKGKLTNKTKMSDFF